MRPRSLLAAAIAAVALGTAAQQPPDLSEATLEELSNIKVTTVSKKEQILSRTAAAVFVITQDDIRRSGLTTLPEVLRLAPGVQVAQIASGTWAVSVRGDNAVFANRLLVLVDGRTVYTPSFSGVFWTEQDIPLEDIERIEVIRGPGATMWGANAVNGVINIITYSAADTSGGLVSAGGGSWQHSRIYARYGGPAGTRGSYRFYFQHARRGDLPRPHTTDGNDDWNTSRAGFRSDWLLSSRDSLTVQGDVLRAKPDNDAQHAAPEAPFPGYAIHQAGNVLARWTHSFRNRSTLVTQFYLDSARQTFPDLLRLNHTTIDFDVQHSFTWGRQQVIWGGGIRTVDQRTWGTPFFHFADPMQRRNLYSGFVQDEITIGPASLTLGSKFEANSFTGLEIQPTARIRVKASHRLTAWAAVSQAARTPSELEAEAQFAMPGFPSPWGTPAAVILLNNPKPRAEHLLAYEFGLRLEPMRHLRVETAAYYNRSGQAVMLQPVAVLGPVLVAMLQNGGVKRTFGFETTATWIPARRLKITGSHSWLRPTFHGSGMLMFSTPGDNPRHQFQLHSALSLPRSVDVDTGLYFVDRLPGLPVPAYARLDLRLAWRPREKWEISVASHNLLDDQHPEFFTLQPTTIDVPRSAFAQVTYRF